MDATTAPRRRKAPSSSLVKGPLEWKTTWPFHLRAPARDSAAPAIWASGTHNQTTSASIVSCVKVTARAPSSFANRRALVRDPPLARATIASTRYPAFRSERPRALPRFPAPTIVIRGFAAIAGRIAEATLAWAQSVERPKCAPAPVGCRALYCLHGETLRFLSEKIPAFQGPPALFSHGLPRPRLLGDYRPSRGTWRRSCASRSHPSHRIGSRSCCRQLPPTTDSAGTAISPCRQ